MLLWDYCPDVFDGMDVLVVKKRSIAYCSMNWLVAVLKRLCFDLDLNTWRKKVNSDYFSLE